TAAASRWRQSLAASSERWPSEVGASRSAVLDAQRTVLAPITAPKPAPSMPQNSRFTGPPPATSRRRLASSPPPPAPTRLRLLLPLGRLARRPAQPVGEGAELHQRAGYGRGDHVDHVADGGGDRLDGRQDAVDPDQFLVHLGE